MTTTTRTIRRRARRSGAAWTPLALGLGMAILVTLFGVAIFALLMQWLRPSDQVIRVFNQLLKLISVASGVWIAARRSGISLLKGALIGLLYMVLGVATYAFLSGQSAPLTAYLADLAMGIAAGGIVGVVLGGR